MEELKKELNRLIDDTEDEYTLKYLLEFLKLKNEYNKDRRTDDK